MSTDHADAVYTLPNDGGHVWCWNQSTIHAELLLCRPKSHVPDDLHVDDCWSAVWRMTVMEDISEGVFSCMWEPDVDRTDFTPGGLQGLLLGTWTGADRATSISTEEERFLCDRAKRDDWMPRRLAPNFDFPSEYYPGLIDISDGGVIVRLPALEAGEKVQIQFTVAWAAGVDAGLATWFGADVWPRHALALSGCR